MSHPTCWCALTAPFHPYLFWLPSHRRFLSVALSVRSPPPGSRQHSVLRSPDFPRMTCVIRDYPTHSLSARSVRGKNHSPSRYSYTNEFRLGVSRLSEVRIPDSLAAPRVTGTGALVPNAVGTAYAAAGTSVSSWYSAAIESPNEETKRPGFRS